MSRAARRRGALGWAVLAALLVIAGVAGFVLSRHPATAVAVRPDVPATAAPSPQSGPYRPGRSWQSGATPDVRPAPGAAVDMRGRRVRYDPGVLPDPGARAVADTGRRFVIPAVGLNVPLGAVSIARGAVTPPGYRSVYLIRHRGVPLEDASRGTVFAAAHALRDGTAPGNYVIDVPHHRSTLAPGTAIIVGNRTYHVTGSRVIAKPRLAAARDVWRNTPGRLVLITCFQLAPNRPALRNLVVIAQL